MVLLCGSQLINFMYIIYQKEFLPPANEVCEGYVFTRVCQSFCSGGVSQHALQVVSQHVSRGVYPSMPYRFPGPHPGRSLRGLPRGREGSPGPHPGVSRPTPGGSPGPHPGGTLGPHPWGCIPACTEADPPAEGYCCRQYASYWNAFLFRFRLVIKLWAQGIFEQDVLAVLQEESILDTVHAFIATRCLHQADPEVNKFE